MSHQPNERVEQIDPLEDLVARFSAALLEKLQAARLKYGYGSDEWMADNWQQHCLGGLLGHIDKGDPRDVAAYCAFMWHHGWSTKPEPTILEGRQATQQLKEAQRNINLLHQKNQKLQAQLTPGSVTERYPTVWAYEQVCKALEEHKKDTPGLLAIASDTPAPTCSPLSCDGCPTCTKGGEVEYCQCDFVMIMRGEDDKPYCAQCKRLVDE